MPAVRPEYETERNRITKTPAMKAPREPVQAAEKIGR